MELPASVEQWRSYIENKERIREDTAITSRIQKVKSEAEYGPSHQGTDPTPLRIEGESPYWLGVFDCT